MIDRLRQSYPARKASELRDWLQGWLAPKLASQRLFRAVFVAVFGAVLYWGLIASERYVSEAHVIIQRTDLTGQQGMDFSSLLANAGTGNRADQMLLRDHLLSVDMLNTLDKQLKLREHWSQWRRDPLSRLWSAEVSQERFHAHYLKRVSVEYDDYSGVLIIKTQAYDPATAQAIARQLVAEGERAMNDLSRRLAEDQVVFLTQQVDDMGQRVQKTRDAVLAFQNRNNLPAPDATAESLTLGINRLEAQLVDLKARRSVLMGYLTEAAPGVVEVDLQIRAVEQQIREEKRRIAAPGGGSLNATVEQYQRLQQQAVFAQDMYNTALVALEKGRLEALRNLKKVSVLQQPTLPEYAREPRRLYNVVVFVLLTLLIAGILQLLTAIIRDHRD